MFRGFLIMLITISVVLMVACQDSQSDGAPILNDDVKKVLKEVPDDFKAKMDLPGQLPFKPIQISALYFQSADNNNYQQSYAENNDHTVSVTIMEKTSAIAKREKIKLNNGIEAFYEEKGILYWDDKKNNIHYVLSSADQSKDKKYQLTKEELANIATNFVPLEKR